MKQRSCVGGSIDVNVGARCSGDVVGAMLVAPEQVGIDMRGDATRGVDLARSAERAASPTDHRTLRGLLRRVLG